MLGSAKTKKTEEGVQQQQALLFGNGCSLGLTERAKGPFCKKKRYHYVECFVFVSKKKKGNLTPKGAHAKFTYIEKEQLVMETKLKGV